MAQKIWDVVIVGGGPAGRSAAIVLARCNRRVLIIDEGKQRNSRSQGIHNFITRDSMLPAEFLDASAGELLKYNVSFKHARAVSAKALKDKGFQVTDNRRGNHLCRRILLATGVVDNIPGIPGMKELWGCSVHHCPFCDGWEVRDRHIGVYSHTNNGYGMSLTLRRLTERITLFTDGARYLSPKQRADLAANNITVVSKRIERLAYDDDRLEQVVLQNGETIDCEVLFVNEGHSVNSDMLQQLGCNCTKKGAAITDKKQQTSVPGVYAVGDASYDMHFVVVAAAEGAKAGVAIHNDLLKADVLE